MKNEHLSFGMWISLLLLLFVGGLSAAPKPGDFYTQGHTTEKQIALTFDDGPGPNTVKFLDLLDKYEVKATFFILSNQVKLRPQIAKMIVERGHEIGSHTNQHTNYKARARTLEKDHPGKGQTLAKAELISDMKRSRVIIEDTTGVKLKILRMPHGVDGKWIHEAAKETGFILVNWTYGTDWNPTSSEEQIPGYLQAIKPGAVILLHDGWPKSDKSLEITEAILKDIKEKGYEVVSLGKLLGI